MPVWTIAMKDLWLLLRDRRAVVILLAAPFIFILILGLSTGEGFGQKPSASLRITVLNLDQGAKPALVREELAWLSIMPNPTPGSGVAQFLSAGATVKLNQSIRPSHPAMMVPEAMAWLSAAPGPGPSGFPMQGMALATVGPPARPPHVPFTTPMRDETGRFRWSDIVIGDLTEAGNIRIEMCESQEQADEMIRQSRVPAILVFGPTFSEKITLCSFLSDGGVSINPFFRDGVLLYKVDARIMKDPTQETAAAIIEQVAQVSFLRVILPWMIGRAFEKLSDPSFIDVLGREVNLPVGSRKVPLSSFLVLPEHKKAVGSGVQNSLKRLFSKYELTGKTWSALTKSQMDKDNERQAEIRQVQEEGTGILKRGANKYRTLVPSYTVMFAFFLVLMVGWLFVSERRQGTFKRLLAAPLSRTQILLGKMLPCFLLSLTQGLILLGAGKLVFGMSWGPQPAWMLAVIFTTSLAAMGMAMLVAALARTETQVAIYGTLLVLVLAGVSGCMMPRGLMPENMKKISLFTPHAWALEAYAQLLLNSDDPNYKLVATSCLVLTGFGLGFVILAWWALKLE